MDRERRAKEKQTRQFMMDMLNDDQKEVVSQYEMFKWFLVFVRRPSAQTTIPFLKNGDTGYFAILEPDGTLNEDHAQIIRQ